MEQSNAHCRKAYIAEALLEYMISLLVTGTFLSAILKQVGVSDAVAGIVSSFISFACCAQLFSGFLVKPGRSTKKTMMILGVVNQWMFALLYVIPFISVPQGVKVALFVGMILLAYLILNMTMPAKYRWLMSFVAANERGTFSAHMEIVSLIGGMIYTLLMGLLVDYFKNTGREQTGFILCGVTLFVVSVLYFVSLLVMKDDTEEDRKSGSSTGVRDIIRVIKECKPLRELIVLDVLWKTATYISTPYYGTYIIGELGFSLTTVSVLQVVYSVVRAVASPWCGHRGDRKGWVSLLTVCMSVVAVGFLATVFLRPETRFLYIVYYVFYALAMAGVNSAFKNILFDYVDMRTFTVAMGARNAVSGIVGFLISIFGGMIVSAVQKNGNMVMGHYIYAQQILSLIALVFVVAVIVYLRTKVRKMPKIDE